MDQKKTRGRKKGSVACKPKYRIQYCNLNSVKPEWITFDCSSQQEISNKLKNDYDFVISRDVIQNIISNRFNKQSIPYLKISLLD